VLQDVVAKTQHIATAFENDSTLTTLRKEIAQLDESVQDELYNVIDDALERL
jgi:hypothetical protein